MDRFTSGLLSGVNDGWLLTVNNNRDNNALTITHLEGEYGEKFTTIEKNNCYRLNDGLGSYIIASQNGPYTHGGVRFSTVRSRWGSRRS